MPVKPIPEGYRTATPYLIAKNAAAAIEFYKKAFGAEERMRIDAPGGKVGHAEIVIGDSVVMLADEYPEMGYRSPEAYGGTPVSIHLYVNDVDETFNRAIANGAKALRPLKDEFYGDRVGTVADPFGHVWALATHKEDVPPAEMHRRAQEMMKAQPPA
jgi:PhnB protein